MWNKGDVLTLTRECELGYTGEILRVVSVDGPYMTAVREDGKSFVHTGRDYKLATKIGESP